MPVRVYDERRTERSLARRREATPSAPSPYSGVLALQHSLGNRAVGALLSRAGSRRGLGGGMTRRFVQRTPDEGYATLPDLGLPNSYEDHMARQEARGIAESASKAAERRNTLAALVDGLRSHAANETLKPSERPEAVFATLKGPATHLSDRRSAQLTTAIDRYNKAKPELRQALGEIEAQRSSIVEATQGLEAALAVKEGHATEKEREKAKGDLEALVAKREEALKIMKGFVDFAIEGGKGFVEGGPVGAGKNILKKAVSLGGDLLQDYAFGGSFGEQIQAAQAKVSALTARVEQLSDQVDVARVGEATAKLASAQKRLEAQFQGLESKVYEAETAQLDMEDLLKRLGPKGAQAAELLSVGTAVNEMASEAIQQAAAYGDVIDGIRQRARHAAKTFNHIREELDAGLGGLSGADRQTAREIAVQNVRASYTYEKWVDGEQKWLAETQNFLKAGRYRTSYEAGAEQGLRTIRPRVR